MGSGAFLVECCRQLADDPTVRPVHDAALVVGVIQAVIKFVGMPLGKEEVNRVIPIRGVLDIGPVTPGAGRQRFGSKRSEFAPVALIGR